MRCPKLSIKFWTFPIRNKRAAGRRARRLPVPRGTSILGEVRNVEIPGPTQQLLNGKSHDFPDIFALAHSKINQIAYFLDEIIQEVSD